MTTAALTLRRPTLIERPMLAALLLLFAAVATAAATLVGNGNIVFGFVPVVLVVAVYAFAVLPVRYSLFLLIFLSLVLDAPDEGVWSSPLAPIGGLLAYNLDVSLHIGFLKLPGAAVMIFAMLALVLQRAFFGKQTDSLGRTPAAPPMFAGLALSFASVIALIALGMLRGGDLQMAKMQTQTYMLLLLTAWLAALSLRGVQDYRMLGRIVVVAAVLRSFYVMFVVRHVSLAPGVVLNAAATHGDSLLFAGAAVLLIVRFMERPSRVTGFWCAVLMPILLIGMQLNNRRLVWVELAAGVLTFILISRRSYMKRLAAHAVMLALPLMVAYVAVGWNSSSRIFTPIKMYRSVTDGQVDASTLYRDLENYNLLMTMRIHPITGLGFGQPFLETVVLPDISVFFQQYRYMPHNAVLGLWAYTGPLGFAGLSMALVIAAYLATRSYRLAPTAHERVAAAMVMVFLVIYFAHCWGDMGFSERRAIFLIGPALAIAGQLAYRTGAYKTRSTPAVIEGTSA